MESIDFPMHLFIVLKSTWHNNDIGGYLCQGGSHSHTSIFKALWNVKVIRHCKTSDTSQHGEIPQVYICTCLKKKNGSGSVTHPRYRSRCYSPFLPHGHKTKWSLLDALQTPSWWWWWMNDASCSLLPDTVHCSFLLPFCGQVYWLPRYILSLLPPELCLVVTNTVSNHGRQCVQ